MKPATATTQESSVPANIRRKVGRALRACNAIHGKGRVLAIVWARQEANPNERSLNGTVVRQHDGHLDAVQFTVAPDHRTIRMLSQTRPVL